MNFLKKLPQGLFIQRLGIILATVSLFTGSICTFLIVTKLHRHIRRFLESVFRHRVHIIDDLWCILLTSIVIFIVSLAMIFLARKLLNLWNWLKG